MSDPRELLALLCPHGPRPGARGGVPELTGLDVAGAMGLVVARAPALLMIAKYALDLDVLPDLCNALYVRAAGIPEFRGAQERGVPRIRNLCVLAVVEHLELAVCPKCKGRREIAPNSPNARSCPACQGRGRQYRDGSWICRHVLFIHRDQWRHRGAWRDRYHALVRELQLWEADAEKGLRAALRRG